MALRQRRDRPRAVVRTRVRVLGVRSAPHALKMGERLEALPATEKKLRDGSLSLTQASICAEGAAADPGAEAHLLRIADKGEMRRLREVKERVVAAAIDETEGPPLAHRDRSLRTWTQGLSTHGGFQGPTDEVTVLLAAIEPLKRQAFAAARTTDHHDTPDAYRFDGLIELGRRAMHVSSDTTDHRRRPDHPAPRRPRAAARPRRHPRRGGLRDPRRRSGPVAHARKVLPHGLLGARDHRRRRRPDRRVENPPRPRSPQDRDPRTRPDLQRRTAATAPTSSNDITSKAASPNTTSPPTSSSATPARTTTTSSPTTTTTSSSTTTAPGPSDHPKSNEIPTRRDTPPLSPQLSSANTSTGSSKP